jgi:sulfite dehydrogenase (quinone) subunit SoeB
MPELGYRPVNKYLPPRRARPHVDDAAPMPLTALASQTQTDADGANPLLRWVDRLLSR